MSPGPISKLSFCARHGSARRQRRKANNNVSLRISAAPVIGRLLVAIVAIVSCATILDSVEDYACPAHAQGTKNFGCPLKRTPVRHVMACHDESKVGIPG